MTKEEIDDLKWYYDVYDFKDKFKDHIDKLEITEEMKPFLFVFMDKLIDSDRTLIEYKLSKMYMDILEYIYIPKNHFEAFAYKIDCDIMALETDVLCAFENSEKYEERYENDFNGLIKEMLDIDESFLKEIYDFQVERFEEIHPDIKLTHDYDQYLFNPETVLTKVGILKIIRLFIEYW